jgi:hypothetical protein
MATPALLALTVLLTVPGWAQDAAPIEPSAIGDPARDLSFSPVPRCRVLDTRVEGGRLSAGVPRHFDVADTLTGQGGAPNCLVPLGAAVVLIRVAPVQPMGTGTLTVWAFGGAPLDGHGVSFNSSSRGARTVIPDVLLPICNPVVTSCTHDITLRADGSDTDVIADVAGYFTTPAVPWPAISGKPAGFADGVDNDVLGGLSCSNGQVAKRSGSSWICAADSDSNPTYTAGSGLTLTGTTFSANTAVVQARVGQACPANSTIRSIDAAGVPTCEPDNDTTYAAGSGLTLTGTTFAVNPNVIQHRVAGTCSSAIRTISANGTVACGPLIQSGRLTSPRMCNNIPERVNFSPFFGSAPAVVLTAVGLAGTDIAPNSFCTASVVEQGHFEYCCWGNVPNEVGWIAIRE